MHDLREKHDLREMYDLREKRKHASHRHPSAGYQVITKMKLTVK